MELIKKQPEIRKKLWDNVNYLRSRLLEEGFDIGDSVSPIFPIMIRDTQKAYDAAQMLREKGVLAISIVYPAVRLREARLRVSVLASHEREDLDLLITSLLETDKKLGIRHG